MTLTEHRILQGNFEETETTTLAFRSETKLRDDLTAAGFAVDRVLGGWGGEDVGSEQGELIVIAHKRDTKCDCVKYFWPRSDGNIWAQWFASNHGL